MSSFHFSVFPRSWDLFFFFLLAATFVVVGASQVAANRAIVGGLDREITRRSQKRQEGTERERKKNILLRAKGTKRDD